jgi:hypothetical protein
VPDSLVQEARAGTEASLATPLLPFLPLVAKQILLNKFLSDVPSMAISTDRGDADAPRRPGPPRFGFA